MSSSLDSKSNNNPKGVSERLQIFLLFFYAFGNAAAYLLCRTVADSEFLSRFGSDRLPELYMLSAGVVALVSIGYSRLLKIAGLKQSVVISLCSFAILSVAISVITRFSEAILVFAGLYFVSQVRGSLTTIQFATVLNEQYKKQGPVHVVGIVGSGATAAGVLIGGIVSLLPDTFAVTSLLIMAAIFDLANIVPLLALRTLRRNARKKKKRKKQQTKQANHAQTASTVPKEKHRQNVFAVLKSRYVFGITTIVCCSIMVTTIVEFQWKATAADALQGDTHEMVRFFGSFYGIVYCLTGFTQLLLTSRILRRNQLLLGLVVYPISMLAGLGIVMTCSGGPLMLPALTVWKGSDVLRRSLHDPSVQVLYSPLKKHFRRMAITFISGIAKPMTEAIAGVWLLIGTSVLSPATVHLTSIPWLLTWLIVALVVWRGYSSQRVNLAK